MREYQKKEWGCGTFKIDYGTLSCTQNEMKVANGCGRAEIGSGRERGIVFITNAKKHKEILGHVHPTVKIQSLARPSVEEIQLYNW